MAGKLRRLDADLLTANEIERLLRACSHRAPTGIRNRAMIAVAWRSGLRIGEVLALRPKDIDLDSGTIVVQHGKGDKRRVVGVDVGTTALLARWLEVRRKRGIDGRAVVFCTLQVATSTKATSAICCHGSRARRRSISEFTLTASVTPLPSSSSVKGRL